MPKAADEADAGESEKEKDALPKALEKLGLTDAQRLAVKHLIAELKADLEPAKAQHAEFKKAMVSAAYRCEPDNSRLQIEAGRMVEAGEAARPHVLDALNAFHAILTPKQRAELVDPVLSGEFALREDTEEGREEGLGKVAEALDLDFIQKVQLLKAAVSRLSVTTSETRELKEQALAAAAAFKEDRFDIREHAIAEAPLVKLYTRFVLDLAQVVLPVLTEDQCHTAAGLLQQMFKRREARNK